MKTVVLGPGPAELQTLIDRRRALGVDLFDEIWEGSYHVAPAPSASHAFLDNVLAVLLHPYAQAAGLTGTGPFNLGRPDDYRVPDRGYHRGQPTGTWVPTAAIVVEIISPDDETYEKLGFYAAHGVERSSSPIRTLDRSRSGAGRPRRLTRKRRRAHCSPSASPT